jgi:hypothetical protein
VRWDQEGGKTKRCSLEITYQGQRYYGPYKPTGAPPRSGGSERGTISGASSGAVAMAGRARGDPRCGVLPRWCVAGRVRPPCFSSAAREGQRAFAFDGGGGRARACGMFRPGAAAAASERQHRDGRQSLSPIGRDRRDHGAVLVRRRRDRAAAA